MWNDSSPPSSGVGSQSLYACSYSSWYAVSDQPPTVDVKTYPDVQTAFSTLTSSFAETDPHVGIYEDAYDMWLNGVASSGSNEVMIWNENYNQVPGGSPEASVTFDGRAYTVWATSNDSYIAFVANSNFTSGTVNLLEFYDWLITKGWISPSSVVDQVDYGVEVCSTNNAPATFDFTNFSINATT
jgi:Glycosyl hydrolase family 12